jgi:hypothetical protein
LHVFYLDVVYGCNGFQVFFSSISEACFKCFNCLQTYVATVVFECFKSRSGVVFLLPAFYCIVSPSAGRASIQRRGRVVANRSAARPSPLVARAARAPRGAWIGVQRAGVRPGASTTRVIRDSGEDWMGRRHFSSLLTMQIEKMIYVGSPSKSSCVLTVWVL